MVSDYQMPEMDGIAFLKHLRERDDTIPFIIFTGRGREEIAVAAFENGADFYIQKGGDPKAQFAELAHKIRKSVEQRAAVQALKDSETRSGPLYRTRLILSGFLTVPVKLYTIHRLRRVFWAIRRIFLSGRPRGTLSTRKIKTGSHGTLHRSLTGPTPEYRLSSGSVRLTGNMSMRNRSV